jgi:hypothetical protein
MATQRINPVEDSSGNVRLAAQPKWSFFHTTGWAKVLADTYGYTPVYFQADEADGQLACLPLMEVDSWLTGRRGIGLPFTDECEPLVTEAATLQKLFRDAVEFGRSRGWKYIECRGGQELFQGASASLSFYGHELDLTPGEEKLFAGLEGSVRRAVRKAEKAGVTVEVLASLEAVEIFYALQCQTRKKHGLPPQPFRFFLNIHRHVLSQKGGMVVLARHAGRPVAASMYFISGERAIYKYGASDERHQAWRGGNLVMWVAIKEFVRRGLKHLDMGRTSTGNEGLRKYKLGWGAVEHKIEYVKFDLKKNKFVTDTDGVSGWHTAVFQHMPVRISRFVGSMLYKHWA